jgi:hypothetical protein
MSTTREIQQNEVRPIQPRGLSQAAVSKRFQKIKAPFFLTQMGGSPKRPWLWLWSRRGRGWIVDQDLSSEITRHRLRKVVRKGT